MNNDDDQLSTGATWSEGWAYRPSRPLADPTIEIDKIRLQDATTLILNTPITSPLLPGAPATGTPSHVTGISATESPFKASNNQMESKVSVSFTVNPSDTFYDRVQIWFSGYNGNANPQLMVDGRVSPISFLCDTTNETVTVTVVAVGNAGLSAGFTFAPTTTVLLDGVTSAPAAPTVTQTALPIFGGIQFSFSQLTGLSADQVQCYKVYRNTVNVSGSAVVVATITHDSKNAGTSVTFQDSNILASIIYYYWVSAVNTTGLESALTSAGNSVGNFSIPVETINLFGNPSTSGTGALPTSNLGVLEQWQYQANGGSTSVVEYRNGRDIRLPANSSGVCAAQQGKSATRFRPGQTITLSLRLRRDTTVVSPNGNISIQIQPITDAGVGSTAPLVTNVTIPLTALNGVYQLNKITASLTVSGGQKSWLFLVVSNSTNCDVFLTEPMLNIGSDAAPFTTNTFLQDIPQFAFEGASFVSDDFTDAGNLGLVTTSSGHLPSASGGLPTTGIGRMWSDFFEAGSAHIFAVSNKASLGWVTGNQTTQAWNLATALSVAYYVQGDINLGTASGITTIESGVMGRFTDSNNFYLARLLNNTGTFSLDLFKRVAGTYTSLGTFAIGAVSSGTIKLQITDAAKVVFFNGTQRISSADNTLTSAGMPGMRQGMNVVSASANTSCDNFKAVYLQNVAAPPVPPTTPPDPPPPIDYDPGTEPVLRH